MKKKNFTQKLFAAPACMVSPFAPFALSRLRPFALSCLLLFSLFLFPQKAAAQNHTDWPFNGTEFKITHLVNNTYVSLQIPIYDEVGKDRFYSKSSNIGGHNSAGAVIEYTINGINWLPLIALHSGNGDGNSQVTTDNWNSVNAWVINQNAVVWSYPLRCPSQHGTIRGEGRRLISTALSIGYNNVAYPSNADSRTFAAFRWEFNDMVPQNCVIQFRMRAVIKMNNSTPAYSQEQTWILPERIVRGNPMNEPVVSLRSTTPFDNDGRVWFSASFSNFSDFNNLSLLSSSNPNTIRLQGVGFSVSSGMYPFNSAGPHTMNTKTTKTQLNSGITVKAITQRTDYSYLSLDDCSMNQIKKTTEKSSAQFTTIKYPQPTNLSMNLKEGNVELTWDMIPGDITSPTDGYAFQWRKQGGQWATIEIAKPYTRTNTKESLTFPLETLPNVINSVPPGNEITLEFRVRRTGIDFEAIGYDGKPYYADCKKTFNPNYASLSGVMAGISGNGIEVGAWTGSGVFKANWTLRIARIVNDAEQRVWTMPYYMWIVVKDTAQASPPIAGPPQCTPIYYKAQIMDGTTVISEAYTSLPIALPLNTESSGQITEVTASKGFYNDRIEIRWKVEGPDFNKFSIHRKDITKPNSQEQLVTEFASTGLSNYYFEDRNALAGKIYTYFVRGYITCGENVHAATTKEVNGYMQPMGIASGKVSYLGSNAAMPNANIIAEYVPNPDDEGGGFHNRAFAGTDDLMVMMPTLNPAAGTGWQTVSNTNCSVQLWYKSTKNNTEEIVIWKVGMNALIYSNGQLGLFFMNPNGGYTGLNFDYELPLNEFVHITTTLSATSSQVEAILYINGLEHQKHSVHPSSLETVHPLFTVLFGIATSSIGGLAYSFYPGEFPNNYVMVAGAYIDEFRHWNKTLTKEEISNNYDRFITGREPGLFIYYRFDEPAGREVFDISGRNQVFNENHGYILRSNEGVPMSFRCDQNVPTPQQLANRGITDAQGNYVINSIPYGEYGSSYRIKPLSAGKFAPPDIQFIFSQASPIANNMNFINESIHMVSGTVVYKGGKYPVAGCYFEVDGMIANINGVPITTDPDGTFSIPVPVGVRRVQVKKIGHGFADDGFLLDNNGQHINYIKDHEFVEFFDTTLVKVIGHVVGGKLEDDKISGHGFRKNNIGSQYITLTTEKAESFNLCSDDDNNATISTQTFLHHDCKLSKWKTLVPDFQDPDLVPVRTVTADSTKMTINGSTITIKVSEHTGEFVAWLPPERYTVAKITAGEGAYLYEVTENSEILDLTNAVVIDRRMYRTSILKWERNEPQRPDDGPEYYQLVEYADTVFYNAEFGKYYQPRPTFTVKQVAEGSENEVPYYGEKLYKINDTGAPVDLAPGVQNDGVTYNHLQGGGYLMQAPVFVQGKSYILNLKAFEHYYNPFKDESETVPIIGGQVNFLGDLLIESPPPPITLDENGEGKFRLVCGDPSLTTGVKSFNATVSIAGRPFFINGIESTAINGIILGGSSTGSNFLTAAGDAVDFILHDPPGSNSYAFIEAGTALSTVKTYNRSHEVNVVETAKLILGGETMSLAGLGAMLGGVIKAIMDVNDYSTTWETTIDDQTTINTVRFNSTLKTSASTDYVGHMADIFVGTGVNTIYGKVFSIGIVHDDDLQPAHTLMQPPIKVGPYNIVRSLGIAFGPTFQTTYYFTTHDIENIMIPKWEEAKNNMLKDGYSGTWQHDDLNNLAALDNLNNPGQLYGYIPADMQEPVYVSKVPPSHPLFGTKNCDPRWDLPEYGTKSVAGTNGPSYKRILDRKTAEDAHNANNPTPIDLSVSGEASNATGTIVFTDYIAYYNDQVRKWIDLLAFNEERKVRLLNQYESGNNISFGGGATIQNSVTQEFSHTWMKSTTKHEHHFIDEKGGYVYFGFGIETQKTGDEWIDVTRGHGEITENYFTTGFVLDEFGLHDQITVDYHLSDWEVDIPTFVFRTRGGQTSCPYEDEVVTQYYNPGTIIMEQTMMVEDPKIQVAQPIQNNVPASIPAVFTLTLSNESDVNATGWFVLKYDDMVTPAGATLKIDGLPIGNGRYFSIPAFTPMVKTLHLEKGEEDDYVAIPLTLSSVCNPNQSYTTHITAHFVPACSSVEMTAPSQNWIVNIASKGEIDIVMQNHNPSYKDFGYVELQERRVGTPEWTALRRFYYDPLRWAAVSANTDLNGTAPHTEPVIRYKWQVFNRQDAEYEFRAKTVCESFNPAQGTTSFISDFYTEPVRGIVDMNPPRVMGISPANGILGAGDEISITFNEDIQGGILNQYNFTISGILNDSEFSIPTTGLNFSGGQTAQTQMNIFTNGSFSIETWFIRNLNTAGTLFAYGQGNNFISFGFTTDGRGVLRIGNEEYIQTTSILSPAINDLEVWRYVGLGYNRENNTVTVSMFTKGDQPSPYFMFQNQPLTAKPETQGILIIGNNHTETNGFSGAVAYTHFFAQFRDRENITGTLNNIKSGREHGIIGYWMMDEGEGNVAKDKVRGRNIIAQGANWYNYPIGYALKTENNNAFTIKTSSYSFDAQSDFTVEFWFRSDGATQTGQTLMSGRRAYLAVNAQGGLTLHKPTPDGSQGDTISIITTADLMNGTWHHFAMAVRRNGSANVFINGETAAVFDERLIGSFATAELSFGAKFTFQNEQQETPLTSHFFPGLFDEIRIWNSTLSKETVKQNRNFKLHGDETGLQAYYPFEKYNRASNGIISTVPFIQNLSLDEYLPDNAMLQAVGATLIYDGAPVNDVKPVEKVPLTYVASNNKIVLNMAQSHFARVEGVTLNIAVRNIRDMRGNISAVENWTAFVRRNAIRWDEDPINLVMEEGNIVTFPARIINTGGTSVNYIITDLPDWLTVTPNAGTLPPMGNRTLTFSINSAINVGNYEHAIGLSSGNGVTEQLPLQLKVRRQRPDWEVNPHDFENSMNLMGRISINNLFTEDPEDLLGAFIGDLCIGLASPEYNAAMGSYYVFITVYGNANHIDKPVTFKVWEAATGEIFPAVETSINGEIQNFNFVSGAMHGSPNLPVIFKTITGIRQQQIALKTGWNMISTNVMYDNPAILEQMKISLLEAGIQIKGRGGFIQQQANHWFGVGLNEISEKSMYYVQTNSDHNLSLTGFAVPPLTTLIPLAENWNHIGYTPNVNLPVMMALGEANPQHGDMVKDQTAFATYYEPNTGNAVWVGNLTHMFPGRGYLYFSTSPTPKTFFYPEDVFKGTAKDYEPVVPLKWMPTAQNYESTMTMIAIVADTDKEIRSELFEIATFSGETCLGSTLLVYEETLDRYIGYLMIYGNGNETITFRTFDHTTGIEHTVTNAPFQFIQNAMIGTPVEPYTIQLLQGSVGITQTTSSKVSVHPNPARKELFITHPWNSIDQVEVLDLTGRVLIRHKDFSKKSINISTLAQGMYMLKVMSNGEMEVVKFVKE